MIGNLLSNGAKFSPDGARIQVTAAHVDGTVRIGVRDEGDGIDAQILPHVFDLFVQGDQSLDRSQGGLGIGLTVAKRLVDCTMGASKSAATARDAAASSRSSCRRECCRITWKAHRWLR